MTRTSCPYLALKDDPTTTLDFPSPGNFCHQARPISPVRGSYQEKYCLTENHITCPLYQAAHPVPLPAAVTSRTRQKLNGRQILALAGIPALVVAFAILFYAWKSSGIVISPFQSVPNTGPTNNDPNFELVGAGSSSANTPIAPKVTASTTQTPNPNCPQPENWVAYTVNPTDSLFRLSVIYGVSMQDLQRANCMVDKTVILPGQVIYVPFIPTDTPMVSVNQPDAVQPTITNPPLPPPLSTPTNTLTPKPSSTTQPTATVATPTAQPTATVETPTTQPTVAVTSTIQPTVAVTSTVQPTIAVTSTIQPTTPPLPTNPPLPTDTLPASSPTPLPISTVQLPTSTAVSLPSATTPPLPTAPPPATATNPPLPTTPPPATATNPPLPTAPPPATATNPPLPTSPPAATATTAPAAPTATAQPAAITPFPLAAWMNSLFHLITTTATPTLVSFPSP